MPNTYTQIYLHIIFAVKFRKHLITNAWKNELYKYITGIIQNNDHKLIAINGMPDHLHIFINMQPTQSVSNLLHDIKRNSSLWINQKKFTQGLFAWQEGFGAFSYSASQIKDVAVYIQNQEQHHQKQSFHEEYIAFLKKFEVDFDEKYIFKDLIE